MKKQVLTLLAALPCVAMVAQVQVQDLQLQNAQLKFEKVSPKAQTICPVYNFNVADRAAKAPAATFTLMSENGRGVYSVGMTEDFQAYQASIALGSLAAPSYFIPYFSEVDPTPTFSWVCNDGTGTLLTEMPTDPNSNDGILNAPGTTKVFGVVGYPIVTGNSGGTVVEFDRGNSPLATTKGAFFSTLFNHEYDLSMLDLAINNHRYYLTAGLSDETSFAFGSSFGVSEAMTVYNATTQPMLIHGGHLNMVTYPNESSTSFNNGATLTIEVWTCVVDDDYNVALGECLGTTTSGSANVTNASDGYISLSFAFTTTDNFGMPLDAPIVVPANTQFAVVVKGFENDDVNAVIPFSMNGNEETGGGFLLPGSAYAKMTGSENYTTISVGGASYPGLSLLMSLSADLPSAAWTFSEMEAPVEGGYLGLEAQMSDGSTQWVEYNVVYTSLPFESESGQANFVYEMPDWVSLDNNAAYGSTWNETRAYAPSFVAQPLPGDMTGRSGYISISCPRIGMNWSIKVGQGEWDPDSMESGVESAQVEEVNAYVSGDVLNLAYGEGYTRADVYNVAGVKVAGYTLPQGGQYTASMSGLSDGVYVVVLNGEKSATVKVVK